MNHEDMKRRSTDPRPEPKPKTVGERQRDLVERRRAAGFRYIGEWVHDDDRQTLKIYAKCLRARRFEMIGETA